MIRQENKYHPVREYLQAQIWDGKQRIATTLIYYMGAPDNEYTHIVTRKMFIASVARVMQPGVKFDTALVMIGPQGSAKSSFIRILGGLWYSESFGHLDSKEAVENIQGVWLMEIPELAAFKNAEVEEIKHFMSKCVDEFRPAYGRNVVEYPRQTTFWPTSNKPDFNKDHTGARRFWPVMVQKSTMYKARVYNELEQERGQIWAEAVHLWAEGEDLHLNEEIEEMAENAQYEHTEKDPWEDTIKKLLEKPLPKNWETLTMYNRKAFLRGDDEMVPEGTELRQIITPMEIWVEILEGTTRDLTLIIYKRIANCMKRIEGWEKVDKRRVLKGNKVSVYIRTVDIDGL